MHVNVSITVQVIWMSSSKCDIKCNNVLSFLIMKRSRLKECMVISATCKTVKVSE